MIRTIKPLPNNLYVLKYPFGIGRYIVMIHIDDNNNVAVLWFNRHASGAGLHIERHGRFGGSDMSHGHWIDGKNLFTLAAHVPDFIAGNISDDDAWKIVCDAFGHKNSVEFLYEWKL
ncbi:hypothetical protein CPT_Solomon_071 [Klebsiella phage Solomon]|uniref:Uncharacterized protein n=1 Tax=Klebsiella phage Solomon TaxID=2767583 RepID=A0A873WDJ8_9CAUD|nr:hypothetical protein CPT_Solomon_071 [Klebsiella phage Solomon]